MTAPPLVAFVVDGTGLDGTARHVLDLCRFLDPARVRLHVICLGRAGSLAIPMQHEGAGVTCLELAEPERRRRWSSAGATIALSNVLRRLSPDLVHTFGGLSHPAGLLAARMARVPFAVATIRRAEAARGWFAMAWRAAGALADLVLLPLEALRGDAVSRFSMHPRRLAVIPEGIDLGAIAGAPPAALRAAGPLIGMLGRLEHAKGPDVLIDAAALLARHHPGLRVVIAGIGREGIPSLRRAQRLGLEGVVHLPGEVEDFAGVLAALDVFVLPGRAEGSPRALLEAMALGRAVAASRLPAVTELIRDDVHALLVPPAHPALLADAIDRLLCDPALGRRLGTNGQTLVRQRHLATAMAAAHERHYARLMALPPRKKAAAGAFEC